MQAGDIPDTYADVSEFFALFDYKPDTTVRDEINRFVSWYRDYFKV